MQTPGLQPTVDYYINGSINKCIELVRDSSNLKEHFDRFEKEDGDYRFYKDNYVIVDLVYKRDIPKKLPPAYSHLNPKYYSFVKASNTLYHGNIIVNKAVSNALPTHANRSMSTTRNIANTFVYKSVKYLTKL